MTEGQAMATAIAITSNLPNWALIDEISIPLLETGVGTLPVLQAALPTILSISQDEEKLNDRYWKVLRIAQLQIEHLLELLKHMEKLESENEAKVLKKKNMISEESKTSGGSIENSEKFKCADCGKVFLNDTFLTSHFERRHPKSVQHSVSE
ncbi:Protein CBG05429 [Caenorhabditis briggsae]|uniref:Protein CBG05429 n=1 Tax=Caenorhabditis briggsae TaxID=6238 RepID=A8WZV0_CAEBR|nr:Protein CBG05429 [Caenorhabditis briggsae]CAP25910.2 Protein CBG05429 [Caenorhabditis briggsae]